MNNTFKNNGVISTILNNQLRIITNENLVQKLFIKRENSVKLFLL